MKIYRNSFAYFSADYLLFMPLVVIGQSCLGSAAAMYVLKNGISFMQMVQLAIIVFVSMFVNGAVLSQQKQKTVFNLFLFSVLSSVVFILLNTLVISK